MLSALARFAWLTLGWTSLGAGALGVVLPVLPTTPFVIVAAFAFGKASPRLRTWLASNRHFGPVISDWQTNGAIAPRFKIMAMIMMAAVFVVSLVLSMPTHVLAIQAIGIVAAAGFILTRPNPSAVIPGPRSG